MQFLTTTSEGYISLFFTLALMLVLLYFMIYRPQKKQEKKDAAMRSSLEIGDQVTTIGGVIGRVVAIKDDTFVLETGADRVKIRFTKTAIAEHGQGWLRQEVSLSRQCIMNTPPCIEFWQGGVFLCLKRRILHRCFGSGFWQALLGSWHRPAACWGFLHGWRHTIVPALRPCRWPQLRWGLAAFAADG